MREALILLEYQGLVRRLPNNHVRVAELSGDCLDHIFELGLALEAEVLEKWADPEELPDEELEFHRYSKKLLEIFRYNDIRSITVTRMTVPCCGGLTNAVKKALEKSRKDIPLKIITISPRGEIV